MWQLAVVRSGDPALGLANSKVVKPASFDVVAYTMMSSPHLLGVLSRVPAFRGGMSPKQQERW
jgi:AraC-type transcriptional regulator